MKDLWFDFLNMHQPRMVLPEGLDQNGFLTFLRSVSLEDVPNPELQNYLERDWRRFAYTWYLCRNLEGKCLEIGANPYYMTALLSEFTNLELFQSNYSSDSDKFGEHEVQWLPRNSQERQVHNIRYDSFNIETDTLPYADGFFDVVLFCEVLEHLTSDPMAALMEIRRVLRPGGKLILTTPNAASARNVFNLVKGKTVYDRYSGYGPYGRHNREFTRQEVYYLLKGVGFAVDSIFTANVLFRRTSDLLWNWLGEMLCSFISATRARSLGQYIFVSADREDLAEVSRPDWLFRSFDKDKMIIVQDGRSPE